MKIHAIVNGRAGTALDWDDAHLKTEIEAAFAAAGHEVTSEVIAPDGLGDAFRRARAAGCDAVIIGGGDGTVRAAAGELLDTGIPLGILPLGTMNRLARDLGIPLGIVDAATALAGGRITAIDVGDVNGRLFLCNSVFGLPADFSAQRQSLRGRPFLERLTGYLSVVAAMLRSRRRIAVDVDNGRSRLRLPVLSMAVSNNRYADKPSLMLEKEGLHHGVLAAYISRHPSGWHMARAVVRAMLGRLRSDPGVVHLEGRRIVVGSRRRRIELSNDGELEVLDTPLQYTIHPRALKVLIPSAP